MELGTSIIKAFNYSYTCRSCKLQSWTKVVVTVNPLAPDVVILNFTSTLIWGQGRYNIDLGGGGWGGVCVTTLLPTIVAW